MIRLPWQFWTSPEEQDQNHRLVQQRRHRRAFAAIKRDQQRVEHDAQAGAGGDHAEERMLPANRQHRCPETDIKGNDQSVQQKQNNGPRCRQISGTEKQIEDLRSQQSCRTW